MSFYFLVFGYNMKLKIFFSINFLVKKWSIGIFIHLFIFV